MIYLADIHLDVSTQRSEVHWLSESLVHYMGLFPFIGILVLLILLDVITGIIAATVNKEVDSSISFIGILKKAQMLLMVAAGLVFEMIYPDIPWGRLIAGLLSISEMVSIIENASRAGVPIPIQLKETLARLRQAENEPSPKVEVHITDDRHEDKEKSA